MFPHYLYGDLYLRGRDDEKVDFHTRKTPSTAALAAPVPVPTSPKTPRKEAETSVGDGTYFSFELHRREVLSKRSQVQIFLRCKEEGQGVQRERGTGEGVKEGEEETEESRKKCWRKRKKEREGEC